MVYSNTISKLLDGKFYAEFRLKDDIHTSQVIFPDIVEVVNYYKKNINNYSFFKLARFFSEDYESYLKDEKFFDDSKDYYSELNQKEYEENLNHFYTWYLQNEKDSVVDIQSYEQLIEIYKDAIKLD